MGSSNPNLEGFPYPEPTGPLFPLNNNLDNFVSNGEYILVANNCNKLDNQNEVQQEFTFSTQPKSNGFIQNDGMHSFMSSSPSYHQGNFLTDFASTSQPLSQESDLSNYQGSLSTSFTSTQPSSQESDILYTSQSLSQGSDVSYNQGNLLTNFTPTQPLSQGSDLFYHQSNNLLTNFTSGPQPLSQGSDVSYHNLLTNFASTPSQPLSQGSNPSYHQSNLLGNFDSTLQPSSQGLNLPYHQGNLLTNNFVTPSQTLSQGYDPSYHQGNLMTSFSSTLPPLGQAPDLSYHQDNLSTNFTFTSQPLNQGSSLVPLNYGFNNPNENISGGFPNERDDYSLNYLIAQGGQQSTGSKNGEVGAPLVPYNYHTSAVHENPKNNQVFNMPPPFAQSPVLPQKNNDNNNNYQLMLKNSMVAPNNVTVPTAPPQTPRMNAGGPIRSNRSAASYGSNQMMFGQGLLGHYQTLMSTSMARGLGRGGIPYLGSSTRRSWRSSSLASLAATGSAPGGSSSLSTTVNRGYGSRIDGNWMAAANMQQGSTATAGGVMMNDQDSNLINYNSSQAAIDGTMFQVGGNAGGSSTSQHLNLQGDYGSRWRMRAPANASGANPEGNMNVFSNPNAINENRSLPAGRGRGGGRRGRKKKNVGITINEGGRTGTTYNASNYYTPINVVAPAPAPVAPVAVAYEQGQGGTQLETAAVYTPVVVAENGGGEVQAKGKEKMETVQSVGGDMEGQFQFQFQNYGDPMQNITFEDEDFDMEMYMNWPENTTLMANNNMGQTSSSHQPAADD